MKAATAEPRRSRGVVLSSRARVVSFEERTAHNPRPKSLNAEQVVALAMENGRKLSAFASKHFGVTVSAIDAALDVAARVIETDAHTRYARQMSEVRVSYVPKVIDGRSRLVRKETEGASVSTGSFASFLMGVYRNMLRSSLRINARRERILREGVGTDPTLRLQQCRPDSAITGSEYASVTVNKIRQGLAPDESKVFSAMLAIGPSATEISKLLDMDVYRVDHLIRKVRDRARFLGLGES